MAERVIVADGLTKKYGSLTAVDNVSFSVFSGEIFSLVGPNGAEKTTTKKRKELEKIKRRRRS